MNKSKGPRPSISTAFPPGSETALLSGRFGDWVYFVRNGQQHRRRYVRPADRRTPAQLRCRARLAAAAKYWSHSPEVTEQEREAWEAAANQIQSRPRLEQSGPLTGQQYFVGRACAKGNCGLRISDCGMRHPGPGQARPQRVAGAEVTRTTWGLRRGCAVTTRGRCKPDTGSAGAPPAPKRDFPWAIRLVARADAGRAGGWPQAVPAQVRRSSHEVRASQWRAATCVGAPTVRTACTSHGHGGPSARRRTLNFERRTPNLERRQPPTTRFKVRGSTLFRNARAAAVLSERRNRVTATLRPPSVYPQATW